MLKDDFSGSIYDCKQWNYYSIDKQMSNFCFDSKLILTTFSIFINQLQ